MNAIEATREQVKRNIMNTAIRSMNERFPSMEAAFDDKTGFAEIYVGDIMSEVAIFYPIKRTDPNVQAMLNETMTKLSTAPDILTFQQDFKSYIQDLRDNKMDVFSEVYATWLSDKQITSAGSANGNGNGNGNGSGSANGNGSDANAFNVKTLLLVGLGIVGIRYLIKQFTDKQHHDTLVKPKQEFL